MVYHTLLAMFAAFTGDLQAQHQQLQSASSDGNAAMQQLQQHRHHWHISQAAGIRSRALATPPSGLREKQQRPVEPRAVVGAQLARPRHGALNKPAAGQEFHSGALNSAGT